MKQNIAIGLAVLALVGVGLVGLREPETNTVVRELGSLTGPDIQYPYLNVNGNTVYYSSMALSATSSSPCIFPAPVATSTLKGWDLAVTSSGLGGAVTFDLSTTTSSAGFASSSYSFMVAETIGTGQTYLSWLPNATSSIVTNPGQGVLGFGAPNTVPPESTNFFVRPGEYLVMRIATGTPRTFTNYLSGSCSATFEVIQ